jgi:hypothetical protein
MPRRNRAVRAENLKRLQDSVEAAAAATVPACLVHIAHAAGTPCSACGTKATDALAPFIVVTPSPTPAALLVDDDGEREWDE